ncbi:serine/arginine repetitive matrix protein 1 isoform X2 [Notolabrus celidotus]|uniref:serine/arginine repetitive matrix protein 1 isoform X2 n=1 Tax=Notolabrus celidotus TaxID=1203425 RepID=UPI00148FAB33|nr:serine/arginine repetitive matrix protein 1 isoform X2 [Notolabrus celidotus]
MRQPLLLISLVLAALLTANVLAQDPVEIQFQTDPVLVQTGTEIVFTVLTVSQVLFIKWTYQEVTLGLWTGGKSEVNTVAQFQGRITITATQLKIGGAQLRDAGNYMVEVDPIDTTGLVANTRSIQLRVFDAVTGVSLQIPTVALETANVSLRCTWAAGTETTVLWGKGGAPISSTTDSRITISGGSLVINPARRGDAGEYTCTVSNLVSAQTATQSLTVYYGPDNPVLTKESPKDCVGEGDVLVGQTVRLTCLSDSLPPALFTWQRDGQTVVSGQPDSGVLSLQTFSTDESSRYVCTARNSITTGTSEQSTVLTIVDICLDVGEVVGIVIGCLLLILIIALLIWLIVFLVRRRRAEQRETVLVPKSNPNPRPLPPDPQLNGARDLGQGPNPPLYANTRPRRLERLYAAPRENRSNPQTLQMNGLQNSDIHRHNGRTDTNRLLRNSFHNSNSMPHNGIDNPAFTRADAQNVSTLPNAQQQNPNVVIQGGAQQPAVHVNLNTQPQNAQQNNNAQMPTIHVNLNSYPTNGQQAQQDNSQPLSNTANNIPSQNQPSLLERVLLNPRMQNEQPFRREPLLTPGYLEPSHQERPALIPTGHTHFNSDNTAQRNANTQTYTQEPEPHHRSDRDSGTYDPSVSSSEHRQMPWDRLRGTPAYPSGRHQRGRTSPNTTDYTTHPPIGQARTNTRPQLRPQSKTPPRRQDAASADRQRRSRSADRRGPDSRSVTQLEAARQTQRSPRTQRKAAQRDIRASPGSQTAPRQEATRNNNPQAIPEVSQQASVGRSAVSQGLMTQQGPTALLSADTRALADPNHLPQAHMAPQYRAQPVQQTPQGLGTQTQPVIQAANPPRQGGFAPVPHPPVQPNRSILTQDALTAHTQRAQTFQNRKEQTHAALFHPGPQTQNFNPVVTQRAPTPPPVIPLTQFQTIPKKHTQHRSPIRGPQPPRPPVNMPVAQRPQHGHHHGTMPGHHHHHAGAHKHAHTHVHGQFTHPQQAHRGRPR